MYTIRTYVYTVYVIYICMDVSKNRGETPQNGWWKQWESLLKWMIWRYPYFWKNPYVYLHSIYIFVRYIEIYRNYKSLTISVWLFPAQIMFERVEYIRLRSETMVLWNKDPSPLEVGETVSFKDVLMSVKRVSEKKPTDLGSNHRKLAHTKPIIGRNHSSYGGL